MTKKHFIALADWIKADIACGGGVFNNDAVVSLAKFCETQNAEFKAERWFGYINDTCGKNGGKVKQAV